jgi:hypothetical protein
MLFGMHSIAPYRRSDGLPYGILKVVGGGNLELNGEFQDLFGGSSKYAYASEPSQIASQVTANLKSFEDFAMELFLGASVTTRAAAANGEVVNLANKNGTSAFDATTGVASVAITSGDEADAKFGRYVGKVVTSTTMDVYALTDIDFARGTDATYENDALKITASPITIPGTGGTVAIADYGLEFTGGSGSISMTADDTLIFDVYPAHSGVSTIKVGSATSEFPAFGAFMQAAKRGSGEIFEIHAYNVQGGGMPIPLQEKQWAITDVVLKLLRDEAQDGVFEITAIDEV